MDRQRVIHILQREHVYVMVDGYRLTPAEINMIRVIFFPRDCEVEMLITWGDPAVIFMAIPKLRAEGNENANSNA